MTLPVKCRVLCNFLVYLSRLSGVHCIFLLQKKWSPRVPFKKHSSSNESQVELSIFIYNLHGQKYNLGDRHPLGWNHKPLGHSTSRCSFGSQASIKLHKALLFTMPLSFQSSLSILQARKARLLESFLPLQVANSMRRILDPTEIKPSLWPQNIEIKVTRIMGGSSQELTWIICTSCRFSVTKDLDASLSANFIICNVT